MKKLMGVVLALAAFIAILTLFIAPSQSGLISSTEIMSQNITDTSTAFNETLPLQEVGLGESGRSIVIAFVMLSHVLFANLHLGGSWVASVTETLHLRSGEQKYKRLARSLTLFNVILFSAGATFAIAGILFFVSLYPVFATELFHIYWWPLLFEAVSFALEILFLYTYWFSWDKVSDRVHQFLGYGYAVSVFFQTLLINMVAAGMLTPGDAIDWGETGWMTMPYELLRTWWINPTVYRLQLHRMGAAISFFGFLLGMLAMFHYMDRKDQPSKRYWDWVGSYGVAWGLTGLVFQPVLGLTYMFAIFDKQPPAFNMIMHGPRAWEMLLMVGLLSSLFLTVIVFFIDRRETIISAHENQSLKALYKVFLVAASVAALILVQPAWLGTTYVDDPGAWINPLGIMDYKYIAIFTLVIIGTLLLGIDTVMLGDVKKNEWGNLSDTSRYATILAGLLGTWIVVVMGFVRESARSPFLIYTYIPVPGGQSYPTPIQMPTMFIIWLLVSGLAVTIFWFTSRVTAHHPEKAEEI